MWQGVPNSLCSETALRYTYWRETLLLSYLWEKVYTEGEHENSYDSSQKANMNMRVHIHWKMAIDQDINNI